MTALFIIMVIYDYCLMINVSCLMFNVLSVYSHVPCFTVLELGNQCISLPIVLIITVNITNKTLIDLLID